MKHQLARKAVIDNVNHILTIDGVRFPWYLAEGGPAVDPRYADAPIALVTLPVLVDGVVTIIGQSGISHIDPEFGPVGAYARALVRKGLLAEFPWLSYDVDDDEPEFRPMRAMEGPPPRFDKNPDS